MSTAQPFEEIDTLSGKGLRAIQAALPEFERRGLDLDGYRVSLLRAGTNLIVMFIDRDAPTGSHIRGNPGVRPGLSVTLDEQTLAVVTASFLR